MHGSVPVLKPGVHTVRLDLHSLDEQRAMSLEASVYTLSFEPNPHNAPQPLFWGYLLPDCAIQGME